MAETWVWTGTSTISRTDTNLVGTINVNKGTTPTDFAADKVLSVRIQVAITGSGFADDSWSTTRDYRVSTAITGSIGAKVNGTDQGPLTNTTDSTDLTDSSPNTGLTIADWEGMEVYGGDLDTEDIWAIYFVNMMADGGQLRITGSSQVTITITYSVPVEITHITDARIGFFQAHTTDAVLFEFDRPEDTNLGHITSTRGHRTVVLNDVIWMVGLESGGEPDTIRLWEGVGGPAVGNWVLHEFTHSTGTSMAIRDIAMAEVLGIIHIVYLHHNYGGGGTIRLYHIEFDPATGNFTDNGGFGTGETHPTFSVSAGALCDLVATDDDELVATSKMYVFLSFGGSTAYRVRFFTYRSDNQSFSGVPANLHDLAWGPNSFNKPSVSIAALFPSGNDVYVKRDFSKARFNSAEVESSRFGEWELNTSVWYTRIGGNINNWDFWLHHQGRIYRAFYDAGGAGHVGLGSAKEGEVPLIFDDSRLLTETNQAIILTPFTDHYGHVGVYFYLDTTDDGVVFIWNGVDAFNSFTIEYTSTDQPSPWFIASTLVERRLSVWKYNSSAQWIDLGITIPTWFIAHTTDAVLLDASGDAQVYHTTDAILVRGAYGKSYGSPAGGGRVSAKSGSNYYTAFSSGPKIFIFEATDINTPGIFLTEWDEMSVGDRSNAWDFIAVSGVLHFIIHVWDQGLTRHEVHHSEYNIGSDTWTHNGSFHNTATDDHTGSKDVAINVRADGDIIAIYGFSTPTLDWFFSINTGAGFGIGTAFTDGPHSGFGEASIAIDNNDVHFILREFLDIEHWHLSPTDVLGAQQTVTFVLENFSDHFPGSVHPLVHNGVMYVASVDNNSVNALLELYVTDAATGSDAPTWTETLVTTKRMAGSAHSLCWFFFGLGGRPTFVYVEQATWKIYKTHLDAGSWIEVDTGLVLDTVAADINENTTPDSLQTAAESAYSVDTIDADNFFVGWWKRNRDIEEGNLESDAMWWPVRVNLNPTVFHTTDAVLLLIFDVDHTTDAVLSVGSQPAITHDTDAVLIEKPTIDHTTDVILVNLIVHTTDALLAFDLSMTVSAQGNLVESALEIRKIPIKDLGKVKSGDHIPHIYVPTRRIVEK